VVRVPLGLGGGPIGGYAKIILVMAESTKKGVKIKTQKQSFEVLVNKGRLVI
jgi:hypothetical protein